LKSRTFPSRRGEEIAGGCHERGASAEADGGGVRDFVPFSVVVLIPPFTQPVYNNKERTYFACTC